MMQYRNKIGMLVMVAWCACTLLNAQGVRVWNHGKYVEFNDERVDSLVFFNEGAGGEGEQGNVLNGHEWLDLGLPSGTLWATTNLGATRPEEAGDYYAWGEVESKSYFTTSSYGYCRDTEGYTKYVPKNKSAVFGYNGYSDSRTSLADKDDAALAVWGKGWAMPSYEQMKELLSCCTWVWTQEGSMNGYRVYGPNGQYIFIPATGCRSVSRKAGVGTCGYLWLRDLYTTSPNMGCCLYISEQARYQSMALRYIGQMIRPVRVAVENEE